MGHARCVHANWSSWCSSWSRRTLIFGFAAFSEQMTVKLIFMTFVVCAHLENTDESINQLRYADRHFLRPLIYA